MKENYEKIILGVMAVIAVVAAVFGFLKMGAVEEDFGAPDERSSKALPIGPEGIVVKAATSFSSPKLLAMGQTAKGRQVDLFTGVSLFVKKGEEEVVDLADPATPPVHPPIPNSWWLKNRIDPGFGDSAQHDEDQDGFSNLEEFKEETDPADANSFPSLFAKVGVSGLKKEPWILRFTNFGQAGLNFRIEGIQDGKKLKNRIAGGGAVPAGETFYPEGAYQKRFQFMELFQKEIRGIPKDFARVKDLKPGKGERVYEIVSNNRAPENDYTAVLFLNTPTEKGKPFEVEEGLRFSLPFKEDAAEKPFLLKEILEGGTEILLTWETNGEVKERRLSVPQ